MFECNNCGKKIRNGSSKCKYCGYEFGESFNEDSTDLLSGIAIDDLNITEDNVKKILPAIYKKAINGIPNISDSVEKLADDYLKKSKSKEDAIKKLIKNQIIKCTGSGFLLGSGGFTTLPLNIGSVLYMQLRMVAAIAKINGFDIYSDQVRTFCFVCLLGSNFSDALKVPGIKIGTNICENIIKNKVSGELLKKINQKVGQRLITKFGEKGIFKLGNLVPITGGIISGIVDNVTTSIIANCACKFFTSDDNTDSKFNKKK